MSYILEALKKSQAERQLGNAPTLHAMSIDVASHPERGARRERLWLALAAGALLLATAALLTWRQQGQPPAPVATVAVAPQTAVPAPVQAPPVVPAPPPAPLVQQAPPAPVPKPAPLKSPLVKPVVVEEPILPPLATAPVEEDVRLLRELPADIQREVPPLAIGGYIYSKNPADRLLLIDKILRREGDQVGPNLVLEKLQRNGAILNFRGYRYRVPY